MTWYFICYVISYLQRQECTVLDTINHYISELSHGKYAYDLHVSSLYTVLYLLFGILICVLVPYGYILWGQRTAASRCGFPRPILESLHPLLLSFQFVSEIFCIRLPCKSIISQSTEHTLWGKTSGHSRCGISRQGHGSYWKIN